LIRIVKGALLRSPNFLAEIVADDSINHKCSVHFTGRREDFAAGQIAPLVWTDNAARLKPAVLGIQLRGDVRSAGSRGADFLGFGNDVDHLSTQAIHLEEIGAHALQHDLAIDIHHVSVANPPAVDDIGHLHTRLEFIALGDDCKNADLARLHVVENFFWEIDQRTRRKFFENPRAVRRANGLNFMDDAGRDFGRSFIGDDRDFLFRLHAQTNVDRVARAGC